jgi:hypothetical protein
MEQKCHRFSRWPDMRERMIVKLLNKMSERSVGPPLPVFFTCCLFFRWVGSYSYLYVL